MCSEKLEPVWMIILRFTIFKTMVLPYLELSSLLFTGCNDREKTNKLPRTQNEGHEIAMGRDTYYSTKQLHKDGDLASWQTRAMLDLCSSISTVKNMQILQPYLLEHIMVHYIECNSPILSFISDRLPILPEKNGMSFLDS